MAKSASTSRSKTAPARGSREPSSAAARADPPSARAPSAAPSAARPSSPRRSRSSPRHGFEAARLDDVAKRAGVAKGTIYLYFADKETLFQELIRWQLTPVVGAFEHAAQRRHPDAR